MTTPTLGGPLRIVQAIRSVLGPFLFRLGREKSVFQLPVLGAERSDFLLQLLDQSRKLHFPPGRAGRLIRNLKQRGIHHSHAIPETPTPTQINSRPTAPLQTSWANVYKPLPIQIRH